MNIPGGWDNTDIAEGNYVDVIKHLKVQDGKNIIVYGGSTFVSALIKEGLIDEYQLFINPAAIGNGMTIFKELTRKLALTLINAQAFQCGIAVLKYVRKQ